MDENHSKILSKRLVIHILLIVLGLFTWIFVLIAFLPTECKIHPGQIGSPKFIEICGNGYANRMVPWGFSGFRVLAWLLICIGCFVANALYFFAWLVKAKAAHEDISKDAKQLNQGKRYNLVLAILLLVFALIGSEPAISPQIYYSLSDDNLHCQERRIFRQAVCRTIKLFYVCLGFIFSLLLSSMHFHLYVSYRKAAMKLGSKP